MAFANNEQAILAVKYALLKRISYNEVLEGPTNEPPVEWPPLERTCPVQPTFERAKSPPIWTGLSSPFLAFEAAFAAPVALAGALGRASPAVSVSEDASFDDREEGPPFRPFLPFAPRGLSGLPFSASSATAASRSMSSMATPRGRFATTFPCWTYGPKRPLRTVTGSLSLGCGPIVRTLGRACGPARRPPGSAQSPARRRPDRASRTLRPSVHTGRSGRSRPRWAPSSPGAGR